MIFLSTFGTHIVIKCFKLKNQMKFILKRPYGIIGLVVWFTMLFLVIVAYSDLIPNNPLKAYGTVIAIAFAFTSFILRAAYRMVNLRNKAIKV